MVDPNLLNFSLTSSKKSSPTTRPEQQLDSGIAMLGIACTQDQQLKLMRYAQLIEQWSQVYNLTAHRSLHEIVVHHLLDSLAILPVLDRLLAQAKQPELLDVGAGAGLPGMVVAIMRPQWRVALIDTVGKKAMFMRQVKALCGLANSEVFHDRVENHQAKQAYQVVMCRAFSSLVDFLGYAKPLLSTDITTKACALAMKSQGAAQELADFQQLPQADDWDEPRIIDLSVPFLDVSRCVVVVPTKS
jgi:16S rRNA (guanine527-N7)-methyltransferase